MNNVFRAALALFVVTAIVSAILGTVEAVTRTPIEIQVKKTRDAAMGQILTQATEFGEISVAASGNIQSVFKGTANNETCGYIVELSMPGYAGKIDMMVGISTSDNTVAGLRVVQHSETPGLGAKITNENFYTRYENQPLKPLKVVKAQPEESEIEAITSATITTDAVTDGVNEAIKWYNGGGAK